MDYHIHALCEARVNITSIFFTFSFIFLLFSAGYNHFVSPFFQAIQAEEMGYIVRYASSVLLLLLIVFFLCL